MKLKDEIITTLGTGQDEQIVDALEEGNIKEYFLINYLLYCVGSIQITWESLEALKNSAITN